jgi:Kef-type K+ transport system membrane component KefB
VNELTSLGIILLIALMAGHAVKWLRIPEVTGYLLAGVALGPSVMGWITPENLSALEVLSEVALGLILFSIGTVFELERFMRVFQSLSRIVLWEASLTAVVVALGLIAAGQNWHVAVLLGTMAMETAAASTLMVMREYNSQGPITELLTGLFALDNLLCLVAFSAVVAAIQMSLGTNTLFETLFPLVWQIVGSSAVGYVIGFLLSIWSPQVIEHGEQLILLAGCVLLGVGVANALGLSPMVTNLAMGATMVNLSRHSRNLFSALSHTDPPLYAIFFVLAGAELDLSLLKSIGAAGSVYVLGRICGKFAGVSLGAHSAALAPAITSHLRLGVFAQAGLAVGLTTVVSRRLPDLAPQVTAIVISAVMLFELVGPLTVRWVLVRSGETQPEEKGTSGLLY